MAMRDQFRASIYRWQRGELCNRVCIWKKKSYAPDVLFGCVENAVYVQRTCTPAKTQWGKWNKVSRVPIRKFTWMPTWVLSLQFYCHHWHFPQCCWFPTKNRCSECCRDCKQSGSSWFNIPIYHIHYNHTSSCVKPTMVSQPVGIPCLLGLPASFVPPTIEQLVQTPVSTNE